MALHHNILLYLEMGSVVLIAGRFYYGQLKL